MNNTYILQKTLQVTARGQDMHWDAPLRQILRPDKHRIQQLGWNRCHDLPHDVPQDAVSYPPILGELVALHLEALVAVDTTA